MKILKIKIKNINCLRSEWEIDFQSPPLSHAGLFAITGPTGSGKSTILDAITLALFNKIPRFESDTISKNFIEKSGSIITMNETDSFVEVEYSCSQGIFSSKWFIATNKRGGLRETDMELIDVSTNKEIQNGESNRAAIEKAIDIKNRVESIENEIEKYNQEEEQVNKMLEAFNEKNAQRIVKHEQLLPHLDEIKTYSANYKSLGKLNEDIKGEVVELTKRRQEENETLGSISKFISLEVKSHNAIKALTDFGIKVAHFITNKLNAEKALNHQKTKISNHLKKPTLIHYTGYETSAKIDELKLKVYKEIATIASKTEDLIKQTKVKPDNVNEQKELLNVRLRAMEDLKLLVENFKENQIKLNDKEKQIKDISESTNNKKPALEKIATLKTSINLQIAEVRDKREKKLRENDL